MIDSQKKESHRERILRQARLSIKSGRRVVPVPPRSKAPVLKNWPVLRLRKDQLEEYFDPDYNIGWITGSVSGNLVDVDLDCRAAVALGKYLLPPTGRIHGRPGKQTSHYWYTVSPVPRALKLTDADGKSLIEIRSEGQQTIIPPSIHPKGKRLRWEATGEPAMVEGKVLTDAVSKVALGALLARHWPAEGQRHDFSNALAGMLLRAGWQEETVAFFIEMVAETAGDDESHQRARGVASTAKKLASGGQTTGLPTLAAILGERVMTRAGEFLQVSVRQQLKALVESRADWPEPVPLGDEMPPVMKFKLDLLPESFRPLVEDVSERMQTPPDYAAAAAVVALAGCANRRMRMQPKAIDESWQVVPNLWGAIIAPPGFMKTPILNAITSPLNHIEGLWRVGHESKLAEFETAKFEAEVRREEWRRAVKEAVRNQEAAPLPPETTVVPPVQKRLVTTDSTVEKLHEILSENPAGVLVVRDELTGWLANLDREGREGERGFFLQAWSGDMSYTMDRIGRGSIYVPAVCVSLLGNIQPARLRYYLADTLRGGANDDGLFQRFQVMVYPDRPTAKWKLVDRPANAQALASAERVYSRFTVLPEDHPTRIRFAPDAQQLFFTWLAALESKVRADSDLPPAMIGHISKYRSLMPSLAALFEMADRVEQDINLVDDVTVNLDHAQQAVAFCDYLGSHAHRVYSCVVSPERRAARELARHIRRGDLPDTFTTRNVYSKGWSGMETPERAGGGLLVLEDAGWVRKIEVQKSPIAGRPSETWIVNPRLKEVTN